ncbi:MAG: SusC/RagA family TonB-linked outer membrane protein [Gemmatimonadetes bacterium]|nr:SusC/RagA family TonB-linked outer membrane protein [Gemmatimonadota bacterium]
MKAPFVHRNVALLGAAVVALAATAGSLSAQGVGTVTGTVRSSGTGEPVASAQVHFPRLQMGTLTNEQGRFILLNVPAGEHEIRAELIGRQPTSQLVQVRPGASVVVDFTLEERAITLEGLVVTGVAGATPQAELAFTVDQVTVNPAVAASAINMGTLLQGRMAGTRVIQGTGQPGDEPSIQLRGPKSIMQSQEPLLIVDGVISRGSLADIDPNDIENIEVVRGAAAASLYGSRAQAGVIEVTTRRGAGLQRGITEFTVRNSFLVNDIEYLMRMSESHEFRMNAAGTALLDRKGNELDLRNRKQQIGTGNYALNDGGNGTNPFKTFQDQPIPPNLYGGSPFEQIMRSGNAYSTYVSASGNEGNTQYRVSGRYQRDDGTLQFHEGSNQTNFRLNLDQRIRDNLQLSLSTYVADKEQDVIFQQERTGLSFLDDAVGAEPEDPSIAPGADRGIFRMIDEMRASTDFFARDEDGDLEVIGDLITRDRNPLYILENQDWTRDSRRLMGALDASYSPLSWLTLQANVAYDRSDMTETNLAPAPWKQRYPDPPLLGSLWTMDSDRSEMNASLTASINRQFGDLTTRTRFRWLAEEQRRKSSSAGGEAFAVVGVPRLGLLTSGLEVDSREQTIRTEGFFAITALTWRNKYVADVLVRRDGSSLFGADERWQTYYRASGAWRMAQEPWWPFAFLTEFKPRYSIGTAGGRPEFHYQYQTYSVDRGRIVPRVLGNSKLKPELATEQEFGLDAIIADRYRIQANYVDTEVKDQLLLVPLSSALGFEAQWRNAGTVASKTWELSLEAAFVERPGFLWTGRLNMHRTRQKITQLSVPPFEMRDVRARILVKEGEELGSFYGFKWARACGDLPAGTDCGVFQVNDDGLLVYVGQGNSYKDGVAKSLWGTTGKVSGKTYPWGQPSASIVDGGFTKLGSAEPDLNVSFLQDFQWRNLGISVLFDAEFGGQIYNQTRQWGSRSAIGSIDQRGKPLELKKPLPYYGAAGLYNRNNRNDWFVEDADFIKLRQLSLRYTFDQARLPAFMRTTGVRRATINLVGRNLKTWTGYLGHDPEVGKNTFGGSAAIGRIDEYFYPNFRQLGIDVELVF